MPAGRPPLPDPLTEADYEALREMVDEDARRLLGILLMSDLYDAIEDDRGW